MPIRQYTDSRLVVEPPRLVKNCSSYAIDRKVVSNTNDPYADYLVYDTFEDDDNVTLPNHTPEKDTVGSGWSISDKILNNMAYYAGIGKGSVIDAGEADVDITITFDKAGLSPAQPGFCFRASADEATYIYIRIIANVLLYLDKEDMSNIASAGMAWDGDTALVRIITQGNDIRVYWDGVLKIDVTDAHAVGGEKLGFWSWGGSQAADDLMVVAA